MEQLLKDGYEVDHKFSATSQGKTGILIKKDGTKVVYKTGLSQTHTVKHEYRVVKELNEKVGGPHFVRVQGIVRDKISCGLDPFQKGGRRCDSDVIFYDYVKANTTFTKLISRSSLNIIYSCCLQILTALQAARRINFSHNDIHSDNVLVRNCHYSSVFLYQLSEERTLLIPTYGVVPVIIDYGYSHSNIVRRDRNMFSLEHVDKGYTPHILADMTDSRQILVSLGYDLDRRNEPFIKNFALKNFPDKGLDLKTGWTSDKTVTPPVYIGIEIGLVIEPILKLNSISRIRQNTIFDCTTGKARNNLLDVSHILTSLVTLPYEDFGNGHLQDVIYEFVVEFMKLEAYTDLVDMKWLMLRTLVDASYATKKEPDVKRSYAAFMKFFHAAMNRNLPSLVTTDVNFSIIFSSLRVLAERLSTVLFRLTAKTKIPTYSRSSWDLLEELYDKICPKIELNSESKIFVWNYTVSPASVHVVQLNKLSADTLEKLNNYSKPQLTKTLLRIHERLKK